MFSSLSFGKVIKTILPGFILTAAILFVVEALTRWYFGSSRSLIGLVSNKDQFATVTAVLLPVSLLLGFLLNTLVWIGFNPTMRTQVDAEWRDRICRYASDTDPPDWAIIANELSEADFATPQANSPLRSSLEYFYLPTISLDRLNYLGKVIFLVTSFRSIWPPRC